MTSASTFLLFLRVGFSLAVVLGLIWAAARFAKRNGRLASRGSDAHLDVVAKRQVGRRGNLLVVEAAGRTLLVGVTDSAISLVADLSDPRLIAAQATDTDTDTNRGLDVRADADGLDEPLGGASRVVVADIRAATTPKRESLVDALRDMTVRRI